MWMDSDGVAHTVALPDPSSAMSPETSASLDALSDAEKSRLLDLLDTEERTYFSIPSSEREESTDGLEEVGLPDGFITGSFSSAEEVIATVRATTPAWRLDVLLALQDYVETNH